MKRNCLTLLLTASLLGFAASAHSAADENGAGPGNIIIHNVGFTEDQFPGTATRDAEIAIDYWFQLMSERDQSHQIASTTVFPTFPDMHQALERNKLDIVTILTLDYLKVRDSIELEPVAVATRGLNAYTEYAVYVRRDREIRDLKQLAGETILYDLSAAGDLGAFWFTTLLMNRGYDPLGFAEMQPEHKASRAVLPVFFDQAAACIVSVHSFQTMTELNPRVGVDLVPLEVSEPLLSSIICFTSQMEEERKLFLVHTLLTLHQNPQGQQVLNLFRRDRTLRYEPKQLETITSLVEERRKLDALQRGRIGGP